MKYIRLFENYNKLNPTEDDVYNDADEYFLSLNPDLMKITGYNTYAHHVSARKDKDFKSTHAIQISRAFEKSSDEVYRGLQTFFIKRGYDIQTYSPILDGNERKAAELIARINLSKNINRNGELGRAIWIKCSSGKTICFYFSPGTDTNWWPEGLTICRFDGGKMVSVYWTQPDRNGNFQLAFWNESGIIDGEFKIKYEYDYDEMERSYDMCSASCDSASDSSGYTVTVKIPHGESDPEDVISIRRK